MSGQVSFRRGLLPLIVGATLGAAEIFVARQGAQTRPTFGLLILAIGAVAGFLPLRFTMPIAVVLGCNQGFLVYFVGGMGRYWKEALVVGLVLRAIRRKAPNFVEVAALAGLLAITIGYGLAGSTSTEAAWGFKLLVLFAIAGWAVARLEPGAREWLAMYWGLSVVVAGAIPFALWQRSVGVQGLMHLGYPYGVTIRVANGSLRVFAGFTYGAPFAYTVAVAALCWVALVLTRQRTLARATAWVPVFAAIGIILSLNRIALVGTAAAIAVALARHRDVRLGVATLLIGVVLIAAAGGRNVSFLAQGFTFGSKSAQARTSIWSSDWNGVGAFGNGPSSAGAAFDRAQPGHAVVLTAAGTSQGVVDNLYLSWLYQYGLIFGGVLICTWLVVLLRPFGVPKGVSPMEVAGELVGVFFVVAAFGVSVWEEFPLNLLLAFIVACAAAARSRRFARLSTADSDSLALAPEVTRGEQLIRPVWEV